MTFNRFHRTNVMTLLTLVVSLLLGCGSGTIIGNGNKPPKDKPAPVEGASTTPATTDTKSEDPYDRAPPSAPESSSTSMPGASTILSYLMVPCGSPFSDRVKGEFVTAPTDGTAAQTYFSSILQSTNERVVTAPDDQTWIMTPSPTTDDPYTIAITSNSRGSTNTMEWQCQNETSQTADDGHIVRSVTVEDTHSGQGFILIWELGIPINQVQEVNKIVVRIGNSNTVLIPTP